MKCLICSKPIGVVFSRQIYLERLPTQNFCVECFDKLMIEYDKVIERMRIDNGVSKIEVPNYIC